MNTGLTVWDASISLALLFSQPKMLEKYCFKSKPAQESTCLELGCGAALAGISLAVSTRLKQLILTDLSHILPLSQQNALYNKTKFQISISNVHFSCLEWSSQRDIDRILNRTPEIDFIFGADLIYWGPDSQQGQDLLFALRALWGS